jgi:UDP-GlcNAc:undecaprenyl-phosphate GlcNAc-1-phosphate transferase
MPVSALNFSMAMQDTPLLPESMQDLSAVSTETSRDAMSVLNVYAPLLIVAFVVTLLTTPIIRKIAVRFDIIDHPDETRKLHTYPIAYLGGMAVFLGITAAIAISYVMLDDISQSYRSVPFAIILGMVAITFTGLIDDVSGLFPRVKLAGQLIAAAALAISQVGVHVAEGALFPMLGASDHELFTVLDFTLNAGHVYYWVGTGIIAIFVLGGCNAANFIDGLDGLLSGVGSIVALGILIISVMMFVKEAGSEHLVPGQDLGAARIVLSMALLGALLGFLPHNFNPASIFLGDCGSLLIGYICAVLILMLGDKGQTHLVFAGLIIFSIPIIDTTLAIIRRKLAGVPMTSPDAQHLHHQIKRTVGGVKRAVLVLYGIGLVFAVLGVTLAALVMFTDLRIRVIYAVAIILFSFIGVIAVKTAQMEQIKRSTAYRRAHAAKERRPTTSTALKKVPDQSGSDAQSETTTPSGAGV